MVNNQTIYVNCCEHPSGIIYDDGGANANYSNNFDGDIILTHVPGISIWVYGTLDTENNYDYLTISNNTSGTGASTHTGNNTNVSIYYSTTGILHLHFHSDGSVIRTGFALHYGSTIDTSTCANIPTDFTVTSITENSAQLIWNADNPSDNFLVTLNDAAPFIVTGTSYLLTGLSSRANYEVSVRSISDTAHPCCFASEHFQTLCPFSNAFNYDNLTASNVLCQYGTYSNPNGTTGVVDYGPSNANSRHTVHTDPTETDPRTNNMLQTIPDGYCTSVRLGNWNTGAQAESITYTITIDTTQHNVLILKYAAVMEDPSHTANDQPKFTFEITNNRGQTINSCYNATFISSQNLGWNTASNNVLWKDWTTVGVDLKPLHGQTIQVHLTTYDCNFSAHYGYAYFVLNLDNMVMMSESCSTIENTFHAPEGFNYTWYREGQSDDILSTADTLHVTQEGNYICRLSFIGAPNDAAHQNCYFEMTAVAGIRVPYAQFEIQTVDTTTDCRHRWMRFLNQSTVTRDSAHTIILANRCESYLWVFDDSTTSTEESPLLSFMPGYHTATLYAMLSNGECTDTLTQTFFTGSHCYEFDTIAVDMCDNDSLLFFDSVYYESGTYDHVELDTATGFMVVTTLLLNTNPTNQLSIHDTIVENDLPGSFHGFTYEGDFDTTYFFPAERPACDTIVEYSLKVWPNLFDTVYYYVCDNMLPYELDFHTFTGEEVVARLLQGTHGEDSIITVYFYTVPTTDTTIYDTIVDNQLPWFFFDTLFTDSIADHIFTTYNEAGCDSLIHYNLYIFWNGDHCDTSLEYPNFVTPNGDGTNDRFIISGLIENNCFKYNQLSIYDRNGRRVYQVQNIHDDSQWWDPNERHCPDGTYFYYFKAHGVNIWTQHTGVIEVLRD